MRNEQYAVWAWSIIALKLEQHFKISSPGGNFSATSNLRRSIIMIEEPFDHVYYYCDEI